MTIEDAVRIGSMDALDRFEDGDDSVEPTPFSSLQESRDEAIRRAKRCLKWAAMCDRIVDAALRHGTDEEP